MSTKRYLIEVNKKKMANFKKQYRDLEQKVIRELRNKVENSELTSSHVQEKSIKVNVSGYTELTIIHDRLTFLDSNGQHYNWNACSLEDLIDILNEVEPKQSDSDKVKFIIELIDSDNGKEDYFDGGSEKDPAELIHQYVTKYYGEDTHLMGLVYDKIME